MSDTSKIEWTDSTFNGWIGCNEISPACDNCYARELAKRYGWAEWGPGKPRHRTTVATWNKPLQWNKRAGAFFACEACGWRGELDTLEHDDRCPECGSDRIDIARRRVFCESLSDWLDNEVPVEWLADLLHTVYATPNLDWLLLTKRIGNWRGRVQAAADHHFDNGDRNVCGWLHDWLKHGIAPKNIWLGATMANREEMLRDARKHLAISATIHFWSSEPLLGDLGEIPRELMPDWVIAGGESGRKARPMHPDWVRALRDQCVAASVPFLFKQWGEFAPHLGSIADSRPTLIRDIRYHKFDDGAVVNHIGKKLAGRLLDGRTHDEFPVAA